MPDDVKKRLATVKRVNFTAHFQRKASKRGLSEEQIRPVLKDAKRLLHAEPQEDVYKEGDQFRMIFSKSRKYDIVVVGKFLKNEDLKVITAHIQSRKRRKLVERWRKRLR